MIVSLLFDVGCWSIRRHALIVIFVQAQCGLAVLDEGASSYAAAMAWHGQLTVEENSMSSKQHTSKRQAGRPVRDLDLGK